MIKRIVFKGEDMLYGNEQINPGTWALELKSDQREYLVGRSEKCDLRIKFPKAKKLGISKLHCILIKEEERIFVEDYPSSDLGTRVNEKMLAYNDCVPLNNNDTITLGFCTYKIEIEKK